MRRLFEIVFLLAGSLLVATLELSVLFVAPLSPRFVAIYAHEHLVSHSDGLSQPPPPLQTSKVPTIVFWAWERPEDLRFLRPNKAGVAFLAKTIYLRPAGDRSSSGTSPTFSVRPRLQPLRIAPGAPLIAVARVETLPLPRLFQSQKALQSPINFNMPGLREKVVAEIAELQFLPHVAGVQIDFDATASEHAFYAALLQDVRRKLPPSMPLSITALASWCIGDRWLTQLPPGTLDEAVPMLFRLGPDSAEVARFLLSGDQFPVSACRGSLGLSTDEPLSQLLLSGKFARGSTRMRDKRIYVFAPRPWTQVTAQKILEELQP